MIMKNGIYQTRTGVLRLQQTLHRRSAVSQRRDRKTTNDWRCRLAVPQLLLDLVGGSRRAKGLVVAEQLVRRCLAVFVVSVAIVVHVLVSVGVVFVVVDRWHCGLKVVLVVILVLEPGGVTKVFVRRSRGCWPRGCGCCCCRNCCCYHAGPCWCVKRMGALLSACRTFWFAAWTSLVQTGNEKSVVVECKITNDFGWIMFSTLKAV